MAAGNASRTREAVTRRRTRKAGEIVSELFIIYAVTGAGPGRGVGQLVPGTAPRADGGLFDRRGAARLAAVAHIDGCEFGGAIIKGRGYVSSCSMRPATSSKVPPTRRTFRSVSTIRKAGARPHHGLDNELCEALKGGSDLRFDSTRRFTLGRAYRSTC